jgi:hypothetical protein
MAFVTPKAANEAADKGGRGRLKIAGHSTPSIARQAHDKQDIVRRHVAKTT